MKMSPEDPVTQEADRRSASSGPNPTQQGAVEWAKVFVVPVTVAIIGLFGTTWLEKRQSIETNTRLYVELMSKREEADSALRKDLFNLIVKTFLESSADDLKRRVLALELLAYNFHESLDISPLFKQAHKDIAGADFSGTDKDELLKRLRKLAKEVIDKQVTALSPSSNSNVSGVLRGNFDVAALEAHPTGIEAIPLESAGGPNRKFSVLVVKHDAANREVQVQLEVRDHDNIIVSRTFHVGPFDFPMLDNTRLPDGQRVSIVLTDFFEEGAEIALVYFPASRASLKEKPYYDEVLRDMLAAQPH
jgi:hypothetical protein